MTDNEKIQQWQLGAVFNNTPDYLNDDAAAMSLLDTLVEKGIEYELSGWVGVTGKQKHVLNIDGLYRDTRDAVDTRRAAVCAAVLELIEKE